MTQSAKEFFQSEVLRLRDEALKITRGAEDDGGRSVTPEERDKVEGLIAQTADYKRRIEEMESNERLLKAIGDVGSHVVADPTVAPETARSLGEAFTKSDGYKGILARGLQGNWSTGPVEIGAKYRFGQKLTDAGLSVESITAAGGALPLQPQVESLLPPVEEPLTIAALFGQGTATQNSIVYLEETTTQTLLSSTQPYSGQSSAAATTVEGGAKIPVFVDFTKRSTSVEKIAAFLPVADEMFEDEPQIASYINGRLVIFVRQAEEAYLMNKLLGSAIAVSAGTDVQATPNMFDKIAAGILACQVGAGLTPDAVLIHPTDFWKMATSKTATSGDYFSGGPYAAPARNPWGITVVVTREAMNGFPLVGAFREGATLFRKGGLSVEASNSHSDYFRKDLTALRAEERLALVILRPKAFVKCT